MVEFDAVSKTFGATGAVREVTLTLESACTAVLLGPSGCGKSTLLRLVMGLVRPDQGSVKVWGESASEQPAFRRKIGYVIQEGGLFPHLTARENVTLLARHVELGVKTIADRVGELLQLVRLSGEVLDRYPVQLSGGQRQRVSLMRALMLDPRVLLLDEPLGAVDPMVRADLRADLRAIFRVLGKTVVIVTHDVREAAFLGDKIVLLRDGAVVQEGPFETLVKAPSDPFVTRFLGAEA